MTPRKADKKNLPSAKPQLSWRGYFRFGESYSSLILGIIFVIIATILLVLIVRGRNFNQITGPKQVTSTSTVQGTPSPITSSLSVTVTSNQIKPQTQERSQDTAKQQVLKGSKSYSVNPGDNLWKIAEKFYKSGYNWVDIARVNNLSNPGLIISGTKLIIPDVKPKVATVKPAISDTISYGPKITDSKYTVKKGDHLWGIAVRAYNDGYRWVELARVNNILNPNIIYSGAVLKIPRTGS